MSSRLTSRLPETATTPRLFWLPIWLPPTATSTSCTSKPLSLSAFSRLALIELTVWSMLATIPFLIPADGAMP